MHLRMPAALALLASLCLTACGPDDTASTSAASVSNAQQSSGSSDPANLQAAVTFSEQQQVTPVVHYAPDTSSDQ